MSNYFEEPGFEFRDVDALRAEHWSGPDEELGRSPLPSPLGQRSSWDELIEAWDDVAESWPEDGDFSIEPDDVE